MRQLFSAIQYCHQIGVIHRRIDLDKIYLTAQSTEEKPEIKLVGFEDCALISKEMTIERTTRSPKFVAPEAFEGQFTSKSDIWSSGVILYLLICGTPPFPGPSSGKIIKQIHSGVFSQTPLAQVKASAEVKALITSILVQAPKKAPSAAKCLRSNWIKEHCGLLPLTSKPVRSTLYNLVNSNVSRKFRKAILIFIVIRVITPEELTQYAEAFRSLDQNGDGRLSNEELFLAYEKIMRSSEAQIAASTVIEKVDLDKSGFLEFSEYLISAISESELLSPKNLQMAFDSFDTDYNGTISLQEFKDMLVLAGEAEENEDLWEQFMSEINSSGDGAVDFDEFCQLIYKVVSN